MTRQFFPRRPLAALVAARIVVVSTGLMAGCAIAAPPTTAATQPTTQQVLRLADARPIETMRRAGDQVDFVNKFTSPQSRTPIYLGTIGPPEAGEGDTVAIIATKSGDSFKAVRIDDERLSDAQWMYAGAGPALGELWGVLDDATDPPAPDLVLVHSTDGGATWQVSGLHKPTDQADFSEFQMDHAGHGRVTLYLGGDVAAAAEPLGRRRSRRRRPVPEPIRAGYYHFTTTDGGKTWVLKFEPDAMTPAADVPEDEQLVGHTLARFPGSARR